MSYLDGLKIARRYRLAQQYAYAFKVAKPWWMFWRSEHAAVVIALSEWDLLEDSP